MFVRLYADNYRCLSNFTLPLKPLSVLLGPNGSGKSTVLKLFAHLRDFILGKSNSLGLFPSDTLTRWDTRIEQTFELGLQLDGSEYTYRLRIKHEGLEQGLNKVVEEKLTLAGRPLFAADPEHIHLFNDRHEEKAQLLPDWHVSGISRIHERNDNRKLTAFRHAIQNALIFALNPALVKAVSVERPAVILPEPDCSDVASWLLQIWNAHGLTRQDVEGNLSRGSLPSFRALEFVPSGDAKIAQCIFQSGRSTSTFRLDELSSGQIALIILEAALSVANQRHGVLFLDEPGNFLGLSEIQPLLTRLQDAALEDRSQVILTAHNPIAIDFLAGHHGLWFEREPSGPTRVLPIHIDDSIFKNDPGIRVSDLVARGWLSALTSSNGSIQPSTDPFNSIA